MACILDTKARRLYCDDRPFAEDAEGGSEEKRIASRGELVAPARVTRCLAYAWAQKGRICR